MRFINIYKKTQEISSNCMDKITLDQVVGVQLNEEQYEDLIDYFEDITMVANYTTIGQVQTFELKNKNEIMEDSPLPDGQVINSKCFEKDETYIVTIGIIPDYGSAMTKIGVIV